MIDIYNSTNPNKALLRKLAEKALISTSHFYD